MKTIQVSELSSRALDWAVALAQGYKPARWAKREYGRELVIAPERTFSAMLMTEDGRSLTWRCFSPTQDWACGGPLIEQGGISVEFNKSPHKSLWVAYKLGIPDEDNPQGGPTFLIAAMRCFVAAKLGSDTVEIPEELLT